MSLPKTSFGRSGIRVSRLGYGSMGLRGPRTWGVRVVDDAQAERILHAVLDAGINLIDTAPDYGECEQRIGRFIAHRRDEYFLATKCGCVYQQREDHLEIDHVWDAEVIRGNLETSLMRMRTDHVDLLQFHGGDAETLVERGLIDLLTEFRNAGKVRLIGVSSSLPRLTGLIELGVFDAFQIPFSCLAPQHGDAIAAAAASGAGVLIRGGVAQGGPEAEIQRPQLNEVWRRARLDELLPAGMTAAEMILRYTLSRSDCHSVIAGTANSDHLAENVAAATRGPLPAELFDAITTRVAAC